MREQPPKGDPVKFHPDDAWKYSLPGTRWRVHYWLPRTSRLVLEFYPDEELLVIAKPELILHSDASSLVLTSGGRLMTLKGWEPYCELLEAQ